MRVVLASANPDKAAEIRHILGAAVPGLELLARPDGVPEVDETGSTLLENARLKAVALAAATGLPAVADDTGLAVAALGGAPGVRSARFAGPGATYADNVARLLAELARVGAGAGAASGAPDGASAGRAARFETVALLRFPDGRELSAVGAVDGTIAPAPRGERGFGYDPVFVPDDGDGRTFAEMLPLEKHAVSHRGRAFRDLAVELARLAAPGPP